jgi:hypothetical protein
MTTSLLSLDAMWEHLESLAAQHAIKIDTKHVDRPADAFAVHSARTICIPPLRSVVGYATALHEVGHIVLGWDDNPETEIDQERAAWEWARRKAIGWSPAMERCMVTALAQCERRLAREAHQARARRLATQRAHHRLSDTPGG